MPPDPWPQRDAYDHPRPLHSRAARWAAACGVDAAIAQSAAQRASTSLEGTGRRERSERRTRGGSKGNLFRTADQTERKYGPAGQLLEARGPRGVTRYEYDPEGNLSRKLEPDGGEWRYRWSLTGMLTEVVRPDGDVVAFAYDALGRRISKTYRGKTTCWIWDGNVPPHEWVELSDEAIARDGEPLRNAFEREIAAAKVDPRMQEVGDEDETLYASARHLRRPS